MAGRVTGLRGSLTQTGAFSLPRDPQGCEPLQPLSVTAAAASVTATAASVTAAAGQRFMAAALPYSCAFLAVLSTRLDEVPN